MMTSAEEEAAAWFVALISAPDVSALWPQFRLWRDASAENARAFRAYELLWDMLDFVVEQPPESTPSEPPPPRELEDAPAVAAGQLYRRPKLQPRFLWRVLACVCVSLIPARQPFSPERPTVEPIWSVCRTGRYEVLRRVVLPDESNIQMDADTVIRWRWGPERREVVLERGRAFFTVESEQPALEVWAGASRVVAVGTAPVKSVQTDTQQHKGLLLATFAVEREGHEELLAAVQRGRVAVVPPRSPTQVLSAGEVARVKDGVAEVESGRTRASEELKWVDGVFNFNETPLSEAVAAFNRYNVQQLTIDDPSIADERIGGDYAANNPEGFAEALRDLDIDYVVVKSPHSDSVAIGLKRADSTTAPPSHRE